MIEGVVEAQTVGDLRVARIAQHGVAATDHHGDVVGRHAEPVEQLLGVGVTIEVDVVERLAVASQKLPNAQRARAVRRANHDDVADVVGDKLAAAQDERPHEDLAQLGVGLDEREQLLASELDDFAGLADAHLRDRPAAREEVRLARELARPMRDDDPFPGIGHPQLTTDHDEERDASVPGLHQDLAARDRPACATAGQPRNLRLGQRRKQPFVRLDQGSHTWWRYSRKHASANVKRGRRGCSVL